MKAPAGPPIWTLEPPRPETIKPPMIAVKIPASGRRPEAIAKAMAKGSATMPTVRPALQSRRKAALL